MARMIPPVLDDKTPSPGERLVFERLRDDPGTRGWTVLHSVSLPKHLRQVEGEVDFVVVVPGLGILCVEVKAHRTVRRDDEGMWHLGNQQPTPRSPFKQSSEAMHSLREALTAHAPALKGVPYTSAVCFTHVNFDVQRPEEWLEWQVIDSSDLLAKPISNHVERILIKARRHYAAKGLTWLGNSDQPTEALAHIAVRALRPAFELAETRKTMRARAAEELKRFTEEQFVALDALAAAPRILFNGPAGTGKTFLAIEVARRAALEGNRTLLCCFNKPLAQWIGSQIEHEQLTVRTFHSHMTGVAGTSVPDNATKAWWSKDLPEQALLKLLDEPDEYDVLVVDEMQDLLAEPYLNCMDVSLRGGLAGGRWTFFSDLERQSIYEGAGSRELLQQRAPDLVPYSLLINCRNTPSIAQYMSAIAGLDSGYARILRPDNGHIPRVHFYSSSAEQGSLLAAVFDELRTKRVEPGDVVLLSRSRANEAAASLPITDAWQRRMATSNDTQPAAGHVAVQTVHSFKGLEAPVVILTGLDDVTTPEAQALLYVALSRPTERLYLIADKRVQKALADLVSKRAFGEVGA